jgi:hypothetical protein
VKVRIGIADSTKVVELDIDDAKSFERDVTAAIAGDDPLLWVDDSKKRRVGVPVTRIAYVEIETDDSARSVGFGPSS